MLLFFELILIVICLVVLWYLFQGAIYLPTHPEIVKKIIRLAEIKPGTKAVDLGSGDGRLVIALAQAGAESVGFEINPVLAFWSQIKIRRAGLPNARVFAKSFWGQDLGEYEVIVIFGMTHIMERLETKLKKELRSGSLVISNVFQFPGLRPVKSDGGIYVYQL